MRILYRITGLLGVVTLTGCLHQGSNPQDPFEAMNRRTHRFNLAFDATFLKPPARLYRAVVPAPVRNCVNNAYSNIAMIPTVANDLLQAEGKMAILDTWRFAINSSLGVLGLFDFAARRAGLPPHNNDLGLTFAKWGYKQSPYLVMPFLGPSTLRDATADLVEYALLTPYPYIDDILVLYSVAGVRYVDLRSQWFDKENLMLQALDSYTFVRDAYLQHRQYRINGQINPTLAPVENNTGSDYVSE